MKLNLVGILGLLLFVTSCGESVAVNQNEEDNSPRKIEIYGNAQGTTFAILCNDNIAITKEEVQYILADFDTALSSYIPESVISKLNNAAAGLFTYEDKNNFFNRCYILSEQIYKNTGGSFDPSVYPLVDGWGFMKDIETVPDSMAVDSLRTLIGFEPGHHFRFLKSKDSTANQLHQIQKITTNAKLDFNAIAKGLSVDVLCEELDRRGAQNYYVEIGGEIRVKGRNAEGGLWRIGIDQPFEHSNVDNRVLQEIISVNNKAVATSGSYRRFYEKNGVKYSHTIDPKTGYPVQHSLLSATVVANDCGTADAMATAFMVMGVEKSIAFLEAHSDLELEAYLIFTNAKGRTEIFKTVGFAEMIAKKTKE